MENYLIANISNYVRSGALRFTNFLDEAEQAAALHELNRAGCVDYRFFGGASNCKRAVLGINSDECTAFPISVVKVSYGGNDDPTHSDFLGSIMGLKLERDCIGDIVVCKGYAFIFVLTRNMSFIITNLSRVKKLNVVVCEYDGTVEIPQQEFTEITGTVASMRLDCVVSLLIKKSRTIAVEKIAARQVFINHIEMVDTAKKIHNDDVIVIRGSGKFLISTDGQLTKKNRIHVIAKKFI